MCTNDSSYREHCVKEVNLCIILVVVVISRLVYVQY